MELEALSSINDPILFILMLFVLYIVQPILLGKNQEKSIEQSAQENQAIIDAFRIGAEAAGFGHVQRASMQDEVDQSIHDQLAAIMKGLSDVQEDVKSIKDWIFTKKPDEDGKDKDNDKEEGNAI